MHYAIDINASKIIDYWLCLKKTEILKYGPFSPLKQEIIQNFGQIYLEASIGKYDDWVDLPEEMLALIIIFTQYPRINTEEIYLIDEAILMCSHAINYRYDYKLNKDGRFFLYYPFLFSEDPNITKIGLEKFASLGTKELNFAKMALGHNFGIEIT